MNSLFVALVPDLLTLCILIGFPKHIDTVSMGLPILYFKGFTGRSFTNYDVFLSLKVVLI